jgi:BirA family transcriptional regulator, biotin operon repressor / biotin---[acetyl-CoA-carboxylase] ligase
MLNESFEPTPLTAAGHISTYPDRGKLEIALLAAHAQSLFAGIPACPSSQIHPFEQVDSTNQTLWQLWQQNPDLPEGTLAIAAQQSAGKGQWGRQWCSPIGGLYLSVALRPNLLAEHSAQLTLCTAHGIAMALRKIPGRLQGHTTTLPVGLKWPNDLVLQGRKLGGILTETRIQHDHIHQAIVGVGINWSNSVPETGINLKNAFNPRPEAGTDRPWVESLEMLAAITWVGLMSGYYQWQQAGIDSIVSGYTKLMVHLGQSISLGDDSGFITGISTTGELQVRMCCFNEPNTQMSDLSLKPGIISIGYRDLPPSP